MFWGVHLKKVGKSMNLLIWVDTALLYYIPASNLCFGSLLRNIERPISIVLAPSLTIIQSVTFEKSSKAYLSQCMTIKT
jgi:hypothetical protein